MKLTHFLMRSGLLLFLFLLPEVPGFAQTPPGVAEFQEVETDMKKIYVAISRLAFAIGAVSGLLGGLRVYTNWQMGKHHIDVEVISWFGACLFLATIGFFLSGLYRVPLT
jgi:hypothetical protein